MNTMIPGGAVPPPTLRRPPVVIRSTWPAAPLARRRAPGSSADDAILEFTYLGPADLVDPASEDGQRREIAVELAIEDGRDLLDGAWRFDAEEALVVYLRGRGGAESMRL